MKQVQNFNKKLTVKFQQVVPDRTVDAHTIAAHYKEDNEGNREKDKHGNDIFVPAKEVPAKFYEGYTIELEHVIHNVERLDSNTVAFSTAAGIIDVVKRMQFMGAKQPIKSSIPFTKLEVIAGDTVILDSAAFSTAIRSAFRPSSVAQLGKAIFGAIDSAIRLSSSKTAKDADKLSKSAVAFIDANNMTFAGEVVELSPIAAVVPALTVPGKKERKAGK